MIDVLAHVASTMTNLVCRTHEVCPAHQLYCVQTNGYSTLPKFKFVADQGINIIMIIY